MTNFKTPSAWAKLRAYIWLYGGLALFVGLLLTLAGVLSYAEYGGLYAVLMPLMGWADTRHVRAILTGNKGQQRLEHLAWNAATAPMRTTYQRFRQVWKNSHDPRLREMGAIGPDLLTHTTHQAAGRQSGARKSGAGGHKKPASSGSDDIDGEPPAGLPLLWTVHDLAATLAVSAKTLQNQPHHQLPPAIHIPGCRGPRYRLRDVLTWLDSFPAKQHPPKSPPPSKRGRPRLALSLGKGGVA